MKTARSRKLRLLYILAALVLIIAITVLIIRQHDRTYFTPEKWSAFEWNDRQLLVKSFLKQYELTQLTKGEVLGLLGSEPDFYNDYAIPNKTPDNLVYDFGASKSDASSNITLIINFGANDRVTSYELKTYSQ
jgi:hypothetical protein